MTTMIDRAADAAGISRSLYRALIGRGEQSGEFSVSPKGARGRAQLMPGTAAGLERQYGINTSTPYGNLAGGAYYLAQQLRHFHGDVKKAVAAYNAGPGAVEKYGGVPPYAETQHYVARVLAAAGKGAGAVSPSRSGAPAVSEHSGPAGIDLTSYALSSLGSAGAGRHSALDDLTALTDAVAAGRAQGLAEPGAPATRETPSQAGARKLGKVTIARGADRAGAHTTQEALDFARSIAGVYGRPIVVGTGTNHSRMTVNGNVSDHWDGHAVDIPARGRKLIRIGQAALIAAGADPKWARKQKGGLYNIGRHQIIFNTHEGGDHTNHVHASAR